MQAPACKGALQCLGQVLSAVEPGAWPSASLSFQLLLSFITDARPKIRKRATSSVTDVLAAVQGCPANLAAASEAVLAGEGVCRSTTSMAVGCRACMAVGCRVLRGLWLSFGRSWLLILHTAKEGHNTVKSTPTARSVWVLAAGASGYVQHPYPRLRLDSIPTNCVLPRLLLCSVQAHPAGPCSCPACRSSSQQQAAPGSRGCNRVCSCRPAAPTGGPQGLGATHGRWVGLLG